MRLGAYLGLLVITACYSPVANTGAPCAVDKDNCPTGQHCASTSGGNDGTCESHIEASIPDSATDLCFGTGTIKHVCFDNQPQGAVKLGGTIDTAMVGGANCTEVIAQTVGSSICVVAADSITIDASVIAAAKGVNPLVLIATTTIQINGTLDVSSKSTGAIGAGAQMTCGTAAQNGTDANGTNGGGGAAGGSFGTLGSDGGKGNGGTNPGQKGTTQSPTFVVGGCPGGVGGAGGGGGGAGAAGGGGGAVYLIAGRAITVSATGMIDASGGGGGAGTGGTNSGGGAGGGGSGGLIGLDAPTISVVGSIFANGGGGGGGNGNDFNKPGAPGQDSLAATDHAGGGSGGANGGGDGGDGYASGTDSMSGSNGSSQFCGGGAGGGGAGIIRVFQSTSPLAGPASPPPSM